MNNPDGTPSIFSYILLNSSAPLFPAEYLIPSPGLSDTRLFNEYVG